MACPACEFPISIPRSGDSQSPMPVAGAMIWRDGRGELVAFNMVHRSGTEGWMGPLAVRTDRQARGHGRHIVLEGIAWLEEQGVRTIGLETMPRTIDNIGFYSQLGFVPQQLTVTLQRERLRNAGAPSERLSVLDDTAREAAIADCCRLSSSVADWRGFHARDRAHARTSARRCVAGARRRWRACAGSRSGTRFRWRRAGCARNSASSSSRR